MGLTFASSVPTSLSLGLFSKKIIDWAPTVPAEGAGWGVKISNGLFTQTLSLHDSHVVDSIFLRFFSISYTHEVSVYIRVRFVCALRSTRYEFESF